MVLYGYVSNTSIGALFMAGVVPGLLLGFALVVLAVLARLWTTLFIAGRKETTLVRDGPYAVCRHPLYAASIAGAAGIGLATRSLVLAACVPLVVAAQLTLAARREEILLEQMHGEAWRA